MMEAHQEARMGAAQDFSVAGARVDDCVTVAVTGDVDLLSVADLRRCLSEVLIEGCDLLVVDLGAVTFMDSVGLGVLVSVWKRARMLQVEMVVWRPAPVVSKVLSLTALDRVLAIDVRDQHPATQHQRA
jgi:anti-anti-sigma factor